MNDSVRAANSGSCPTGQAPTGLVASRGDPGRTPTLQMLELSVNESLIDDVTQVIQRTPYICRYPKRLWTVGLVGEFADAIDRLNVKLAELQGADR